MARILDKLLPISEAKAISLRLEHNWLRTEYNTLPEAYQKKREKKLQRLTAQANRKLLQPAFDACDKERYAQCQLEEKLQKFDTKAYLSQREVHHKAIRSIFQAVKADQDWSGALATMDSDLARLQQKRQKYLLKLEEQKKALLGKLPNGDPAAYQALKQKLQSELEAQSAEMERKDQLEIEKKRTRMQKKMEHLSAKLSAFQENRQEKYHLDEDVVLSVQGLKMYFGGLKAVDDLSFDVKRGEIFGLIGPNGAGKTTVFNCITQFYKPTDGKLLMRNRHGHTLSLTDYQVHDIVLNGIARTFQNVEVVKEVSVLDNLLIAATRQYTSSLVTQMFHLPKLGREEAHIRAKADRILEYMDLRAYRDRLSWGLPYGVLKRVEIARALMCDPELIILDEPAAGLNESETRELASLINRIRQDMDCTILLVEHDMSLVMNVCDHICAISFGKKLAYGTAAEIQQSPEVQAAYLGTGGE